MNCTGSLRFFPPVPWPSWIGRPEPETLRCLPGGSVTAGTIVVVILGVLIRTCVCIVRCFIRKKSIEEHCCAAEDAGGAKALAGCVGPKIVIVLRQDTECKHPSGCCTPLLHPKSPIREALYQWLRNPKHLVCVPVKFEAPTGRFGAPALCGHEVWVVGITEWELRKCYQQYGLLKLVDHKAITQRFSERPKRVVESLEVENTHSVNPLDVRPTLWFDEKVRELHKRRLSLRFADRTGKFNIWLPWTSQEGSEGLFKKQKEGTNFFSPHEVLKTIQSALTRATDSDGKPVFLAAHATDEIEALFPLVDRPEDQKEFKDTLARWKTVYFWRQPPSEDIARLFGPSVAVYFSFMQVYAMSLIFPAVCVICSLVWHLHYAPSNANLSWGATFAEGWSQALFTFSLLIWSSLFLLGLKNRIGVEMLRLGQDDLINSNARDFVDGSRLFFKRRGFKLSKRRGVEHVDIKPRIKPSILRGTLTILCFFLVLAGNILIIAMLCWISDKAALVTYSEDSQTDELLKNLVSVASYLVVSTPLQGVYDQLTYFITEMEDRQEHAEFVYRLVRRKAAFQLINYLGWFVYLGLYAENMVALRSQLTVFFLLKPSGLLGTFVALLASFCRAHKDYGQEQLTEMILQEWSKPSPSLFEEYTQIAIVFAAALVFAPVFPEGLVIALLHTIFEYFGDKFKLYSHVRVEMPNSSDFHAITSWVEVWQIIGWAAVITSPWLVNVFVEEVHLAPPTDDDHLGVVRAFLQGLSLRDQRIFMIVFLEHFLLICKSYLNITVTANDREVERHRKIVFSVLDDEHPSENYMAGSKANPLRRGVSTVKF